MKARGELLQAILKTVNSRFLDPARLNGTHEVFLTASQIDQVMGRINRTPSICNALTNQKRLFEYGAKLINTDYQRETQNAAPARWFRIEVCSLPHSVGVSTTAPVSKEVGHG